jgi:cell division transport system permease protein
MIITLFVVAGLMMANAALSATLDELQQKVDVNVYFVTEAEEEQVLAVKESLEALPEVAAVEYVSREQALERFRERYKNNQTILQGLDLLEDNPLGASLGVRAHDPSQYETIARFLSTTPAVVEGGESIIEKVSFLEDDRNRRAIERLGEIINASRQVGLAITIILGFASLLIAFNTIRLAIYTSRDEISVMKLVGAGPWYVRGPFMVSGVLYGLISGIIVLAALYPITLWLAADSERFFGGSYNTFTYYTQEFVLLFGVIMGVGILLGALSSYLAVHRYLRY